MAGPPDERPDKRRRSGAAPPPSIPDDLLFSDVLPRLPVKSLVRSKSVSRNWRDAIVSPALARRHLKLSSSSLSSSTWPPPMLVVPREAYHLDAAAKSSELSFYRLLLGDGDPRVELVFEKAWAEGVTHAIVLAHCDGLVAVATSAAAGEEVFVSNPATREFVALPPGTPTVHGVLGTPAVALGYDSSREKYVVARYFYRTYEETVDVNTSEVILKYDIGHEVFTLGDGDNTWEVTDDPPQAIAAGRPICAREAFYWCAEHDDERQSAPLLRFGLRDRAFSVVPCPLGTDFHYDACHVADLGGKLCCVHPATGSDTTFDVWVADDEDGPRRTTEWSLRCRVDLEDDALGGEAFLRLAVDGDEMLVAVDYKRLYVYDERLRSLRLVVDMEEELEYERLDGSMYDDGDLLQHHVVPYVESLVSIRARQCSKVG